MRTYFRHSEEPDTRLLCAGGAGRAHAKSQTPTFVRKGDQRRHIQDAYLFTGREFGTATGLQYNRARWLDPEVGRWISEDPLSFVAGDANVGRYVGNEVTGASDPTGCAWLGWPSWHDYTYHFTHRDQMSPGVRFFDKVGFCMIGIGAGSLAGIGAGAIAGGSVGIGGGSSTMVVITGGFVGGGGGCEDSY